MDVVFYGASGHSIAVRDSVEVFWKPNPLASIVAYIDDFRGDRGESIDGAPIISFETWRSSLRDCPVFLSLGDPQAKRTLAERIRAAGGRFPSFYERSAPAACRGTVGEGSVLGSLVSIGPSTVIGRHVQVMPLASVDAGCTVGDYASICPSSTIFGRVVLGECVYVGAGARIVNHGDEPLTVGADAVIGAGAVLTRSVRPGEKLVGDPATDLRTLAAKRAP